MENLVKHDAGVTLPETFAKTVTLTPKEIKIIKRYDPYQDPPDLEMAVEHGKAKRVYKQIKEDKYRNDMKKACSCCGLAIEGTQLPLNADLKEIYYLGSGYASYFAFIKYSAALLILLFITSGLFNILTNYYGEGCHSDVNNEPCDESFISRFALNNKRDDVKLLSVALVLNFAAVIAIIVFFHLIRYKFRKAEKNVDNETVTPSDYTLELKGIEPTMSDKEIASWLKKFGNPECPLNIVKINRTFNITKYIQQSKQRDVLMKRQAKFYENQDKSKAITNELGQIEAYFETFKRKKLDPTQVVYVIFQTAAEAEYVRDKFQKGFLREKFEHFFSLFISTYDRIAGKKITVKRAPEPTDILWENLHSSFGERFKRKIFVGFITATLVIIGLGIVVLINWLQKLIKGLDNAHWIRPLSLASSLLIFFWDLIVGFIIKKLASTEKNPTLTAYHTGLAGKLSVIQLINSGLTTLFAKLIIANDFSFSVSFKEKFHSINIYENGGLIENMYFVFIIFAFLQPLLTLFDPVYFYNRWRQSQVKHGKLQKKMNQKQAHQFFEGPELDMSEKYATLISNILVSSFYTPVMPFALLYSLMGLVLTYWIDKYVLFRRAALPKSLNNDLSSSMIEYLEWMAFMFAMGNFLFTYTLQGSSEQDTYNELPTALIWVTLGTSLFHIYFPMGWLNKQIFRIPMDKNETETYQQARFEFTTDYDIENPITRKQALKEFMFEVKGMIDMGSYDKKTMSTKGGAFTKLNLHEIAKLLDPNSQDDNQDFQFLEKYAHEARETNILERKTSIVNLRMDIIRLLSKFDNFKKRHSRSTIVAQFITNAKYSIGIKESRERLNSDNNYSRDSFKTPNHRDSILNSYDSEIRDDDFRSTVALRLNHTGYTGHELSRFADFKETSPTNQAGEDEILNFHVRQEFAQRSIVVQHKKFNYKNI